MLYILIIENNYHYYSLKKGGIMKKLLLVCFVVLAMVSVVYGGEKETDVRFTLGTTAFGSVGCDLPEDSTIYKFDIGVNLRHPLPNNFFWDLEGYIPVIYNDKPTDSATAFGAGARIRGGYNIIGDLRVFIGGGFFTLIVNNDQIDGLAQSALYGSLEGGLEYKSFTIGIDHGSSPFHDSAQGDSGFNTLYVGYQYHF
jgi:hypothetical protein